MHDSLCRSYAPFLRRVDARLYLDYCPDSRDATRRSYWVRFDDGGFQPKLCTLQALAGGERRGPGAWVADALGAFGWAAKVHEARQLATAGPSVTEQLLAGAL